eukprot:GHVT01033723.1.p1 GENE.GHVT01033723.1~~GHVT01033723.1.p1  ORF type:complete len:404 (+),score=102.43 GHVT01033723.1:534-1745(+)
MTPGVRSSPQAHSFARSFLEDARAAASNGRETPQRPLARSSRPSTSKSTADHEGLSGPSRCMAATDYGRWEELEANLRAEEDQARLQKEEASKKTRSMMGGCSRDHTQERQLFEKSTPEKLEAAERFRLEGNEAFKDSNWGLAAVNYRRALLQFDYTFPDTEEDIAKAAALQLRCILNLAAAKLKQEDYKEVLHQCKQALDIDSSCVKALYRRGVAFSAMENFDEAEEALKAAYAAEPTNADVIREIKIVRLKRQQYRRKSQRIAQAAVASTSPSRGSPQDASQGAPPQVAGKLEEEERRHLCCLLLGAVLAISARTPTTFFVTLAAATAAVLAASIVIHRSAAALNFTSTYTNPDAPSAPCPPPPTQSTYSVRDSFTSCASDAVNARTAAGTVRRRIAAASL